MELLLGEKGRGKRAMKGEEERASRDMISGQSSTEGSFQLDPTGSSGASTELGSICSSIVIFLPLLLILLFFIFSPISFDSLPLLLIF